MGGIEGADEGQAEGKTTAQFASGEVAYLLSEGENCEAWGQTLTGNNLQTYPVIDAAKVYKTTPCVSYSNENVTEKAHTDSDGDGICNGCGETLINVTLKAETENGIAFDKTTLTGAETAFVVGDSTTVTATAVAEYTFLGWYNGDTLLSEDPSFEYTVTESVTLTAKFRNLKDLNADGIVNIADVTALLDYLSNDVNVPACGESCLDLNGDETVNISDVTALLDYLASSVA